jgi:hypothetical protein
MLVGHVPVINIVITIKVGMREKVNVIPKQCQFFIIVSVFKLLNCFHTTERGIYSSFCFYMSNYGKLLFVQFNIYAENNMTRGG